MGYKGRVVKGLGWLTFLKFFSKALTVGKIVVIARVLSPTDFGLFGLVTVILTLAEVFTETGINPFLIQTSKNYLQYLNTAWIIAIVRGFLIGFVLVLLSMFVSSFYREPFLLPLMVIASLIPMIKGFINPALVRFQREFEYHKDVYLRLGMISVDVVFSIVFVFIFHSALAMILSQVVAAVAEVVITHLYINPKPKFAFSKSKARDVLHFGAWLNIGGILSFLGSNLDDLIVGKLMGTGTLGYYQNAFSVSQSAVGEFGDLVAQATFPAFGRIKLDLFRLRRAFFMSFVPFAGMMLIPLGIVFLFKHELVLIILGEKWLPIVPVLPWLASSAYFQALNAVMFPLNIVRAKTQYTVLILLTYLVLMVYFLVNFSATRGLVGVGIALFLARLLVQPLAIIALFRVLYKKTL